MKFKSASFYRDERGKMVMVIEVLDRNFTIGAKPYARRITITKRDAADLFLCIVSAFGLKVGR